MAKDFASMEASNPSTHPGIHEVSDPSRRIVLHGGLAAAVTGLLAPLAGCATGSPYATPRGGAPAGPLLGFRSVPIGSSDSVVVPEGYSVQVLAPWGDPVGLPGRAPAFRFDAAHSAEDQEAQFGMHHDGIHWFALPGRPATAGLLVMNHEYIDEGLLHADGFANWSAQKVRKSQAAHGVSVAEVELRDGRFQVVAGSRWARRITANTPMLVAGPAAGHSLMRTAADPTGTRVLGTLNNCGSGITPWGTYLTCEENFVNYFAGPQTLTEHQRRWGLRSGPSSYRWHEHDERFDAARHPNEFNRFGWVVEIDPYDPTSPPIKRTALGRAAHEGATVAVTRDGRAVVYMGEDARFEYIYKFVSRDRIRPGGAKANATLLDHGTLYVARFDADGRGRWLPLVHGNGFLTAQNGFADQGEVLVRARRASDALGGTPMDRPEWIDVDREGWVYCTLTNNSNRGQGNWPQTVDAANPRANNSMGHIIRWKEDGDFDGTAFVWNHFVLAGDPASERTEARGNVKGDAFACPDGLWTDARGVLWIQTDMSTSAMGRGDLARLGNNAMLAADPRTGEIRRFLVGPVGCEITGATATPDGRFMFINIQHPGESPSERSDPTQPRRFSNWPDGRPDGRPRSATIVIRKNDGGPIGT